jgi:hypothetical protein
MNYEKKYEKYKNRYIELKKQIGGVFSIGTRIKNIKTKITGTVTVIMLNTYELQMRGDDGNIYRSSIYDFEEIFEGPPLDPWRGRFDAAGDSGDVPGDLETEHPAEQEVKDEVVRLYDEAREKGFRVHNKKTLAELRAHGTWIKSVLEGNINATPPENLPESLQDNPNRRKLVGVLAEILALNNIITELQKTELDDNFAILPNVEIDIEDPRTYSLAFRTLSEWDALIVDEAGKVVIMIEVKTVGERGFIVGNIDNKDNKTKIDTLKRQVSIAQHILDSPVLVFLQGLSVSERAIRRIEVSQRDLVIVRKSLNRPNIYVEREATRPFLVWLGKQIADGIW